MLRIDRTATVAAIMLAAPLFTTLANAADQDVLLTKAVKAPVKPADQPFFYVIDDRVTFSWMPKGTDPGHFSVNPNGTFNGTTAKQVYSFTHFDAWQYGTNFLNINLFKSDHNDPAMPCVNAGVLITGAPANCAGATEAYGLIRSTFGFNEIFNTKAFTVGPLRNVSFEVGADAGTYNTFLGPAKRDFVAGLQFAFDLPYKGFLNVAPMAYKEIGHSSFTTCGFVAGGVAGVTCNIDGNTDFRTTWAIETNYYMDLGFLPENLQFFAISGRAAWYGPQGNLNSPLGPASGGTPTKVELNSEPIRLTLDASKAIWGPKYSHNVDVWVAYRYWQNKFRLDHNAAPGICTVAGVSTNTCTESTVYSGVTVKF